MNLSSLKILCPCLCKSETPLTTGPSMILIPSSIASFYSLFINLLDLHEDKTHQLSHSVLACQGEISVWVGYLSCFLLQAKQTSGCWGKQAVFCFTSWGTKRNWGIGGVKRKDKKISLPSSEQQRNYIPLSCKARREGVREKEWWNHLRITWVGRDFKDHWVPILASGRVASHKIKH